VWNVVARPSREVDRGRHDLCGFAAISAFIKELGNHPLVVILGTAAEVVAIGYAGTRGMDSLDRVPCWPYTPQEHAGVRLPHPPRSGGSGAASWGRRT
jgi:hypothetical protein